MRGISGRSAFKAAIVVVLFFALAPLSYAATFDRSLSLGATGPDVSSLQEFLKAKGFYTYPTITGYFGPATKDAVAKYQASIGLEAVGVVGPKTLASLNGGSASSTASPAPTSTLSMLVAALQKILTQAGYYSGPISGVLDTATQTAALSATSGTPADTTTTTTTSNGSSSGSSHSSGGGGGSSSGTRDSSAPVISSITSGSLTDSSVTITWTTDEPATSQIEYGPTTAYGLASGFDDSLLTSHSVTLTGLSPSTTYHYRLHSQDISVNEAVTSDGTFTTSVAPDTTPPVRSNGSPTGTLALNTSETTIALDTDESATCKYSAFSGLPYSSMTTFDSTGGTSHSALITDLSNGFSYIYYVKCQDADDNTNSSDYTISFTVAADSTSPSVALTAPGNNTTVSGASVTLSATASDDVSVSGVQFRRDGTTNIGVEDTTSTYGVAWNSTAVSDGTHTLTAVARDGSGNYATSSTITVTVDNTAPIRSSGSPTGTLAFGTTGTTLSLSTNESATCKYSASPGTSYGSMTAFGTTGGTSHSTAISGLANGGSYTYYVKCQDSYSNTSATDYSISFSVAADTTAPTVSMSAPTNASTIGGASVAVSAIASDDNGITGVQFRLDTNTNVGAEDTSSPYGVTLDTTALVDGPHSLIAVARDGSGNYATSSAINVTVDNTAPVRSAGSPTGTLGFGTASTLLSLTTDETSSCAYSQTPNVAFATMTAFDTTNGTSHSTTVSGLANGSSYTYYVKCQDPSGNTDTADYSISFSIAGSSSSYYVSPTGSDSNDGLSSATPWQTISKVNAGHYTGGTNILFQGGQSFSGCLAFSSSNVSGAGSTSPLTVGSYGTGNFTLNANCSGTRTAAIDIQGVSGITIQDGILRGNSGGVFYGVLIRNSSNTVVASDITVQRMDIGGFWSADATSLTDFGGEIFLDNNYGNAGMNRIEIAHNTLHGLSGATSNDERGVGSRGNSKITRNVHVAYNTVYDIGGRALATTSPTGSGIVLVGVDGGTIEYNVGHDLGGNSHSCGGSGGMWAYTANNITIQYNETYRVQPVGDHTGGCDWIGYDLDGFVTNSVIQYNYSHDNYGAGILLYQRGNGAWGPNTARYNLSVNDQAGYGDVGNGSLALSGGGATGSVAYVYNNTIWSGNTSVAAAAYALALNTVPESGLIANNLFIVNNANSNAKFLYDVDVPSSNFLFKNNTWYALGGGSPIWKYSNTNYSTLSAWQAVVAGGDTNASTADPLLFDPGVAPTCGGYSTSCGSDYRLQNGSPAAGTGLNLTLSPYSLSVGSQDYFGNTIPHASGTGFNNGADGANVASGPDTTRPTVSLTAPASGATLAGSVTLTATNSDNVGVTGVQFKVDGSPVGSSGTGSPYSISWDSTGVSDGVRTISAVAHDAAGNYATSSVSVTISNSAPILSSISSGTPTGGNATVTWTSNVPGTSRIAYSTDTSYSSYTTLDSNLVTSHSVSVTGLSNATTYNYKVVSTDGSGRIATSTAQTLTTANPPGWVLSSAQIDIDFQNNRAWSPATGLTTASAFLASYNRSGTGYAETAAGTLTSFATGTPRITDKGYLAQVSRTNELLRSRDFTNASWTKSNITAALDQTGVDGVSTSASSLLATAGNATVLQSLATTSAARYFSVYMKRLSGTGNIDITLDGGTTWTGVQGSINGSTYARVGVGQTLSNPSVGVRLVTSGDSVAVDFAQEEGNITFASAPILTTSAAASTGADIGKLSSSVTSLLNTANNSGVIQAAGSAQPAGTGVQAGLLGTNSNGYLYINGANNRFSPSNYPVSGGNGFGAILGSGTIQSALKAGFSMDSVAGRYALVANNGTLAASSTGITATSWTFNTIGLHPGSTVRGYGGYITRATFWSYTIVDAALKALTQ